MGRELRKTMIIPRLEGGVRKIRGPLGDNYRPGEVNPKQQLPFYHFAGVQRTDYVLLRLGGPQGKPTERGERARLLSSAATCLLS